MPNTHYLAPTRPHRFSYPVYFPVFPNDLAYRLPQNSLIYPLREAGAGSNTQILCSLSSPWSLSLLWQYWPFFYKTSWVYGILSFLVFR